jgi:hypothetical protein
VFLHDVFTGKPDAWNGDIDHLVWYVVDMKPPDIYKCPGPFSDVFTSSHSLALILPLKLVCQTSCHPSIVQIKITRAKFNETLTLPAFLKGQSADLASLENIRNGPQLPINQHC